MTLQQTEPKKIYIGVPRISDLQGPCQTGFHVPTRDEIGNLETAVSNLGITIDGTILKTYLKMPYTGNRLNSSGGINYQNTFGYYWTSTPYWINYGRYRSTGSGGITYGSWYRAYGLCIRPFKDYPIIPDSSWTTLFDGSGVATNAGIFHNSTLGYISVSSDGINWITISDKNLGATTVYNDGDTLSEANCGKYFQRGNNYGFAWTGSITTSSTQVDATGYGPGNYYSGSTFIIGNNDWSSVRNDNLWGYETREEPSEVKKIMMRPGGVEKQIRPAGWTPGVNTILYVPMDTDLLDHGPNNISLTNTNVTISNVGGVNAGLFPAINDYYNLSADLSSYISSGDYTVLVWINGLELPIGSNPTPWTSIRGCYASGPYRGASMVLRTTGFGLSTEGYDVNSSVIPTLNTWYLLCGVYKTNEGILYINGNQTLTNNWTLSYAFQNFGIGQDWYDDEGKRRHWRGYMSNFIIENKARTAQEVSDYYNQTKGNYGL